MALTRKNCLKMADCIERRLYKIASRNLSYGVYDGHGGFLGIRNKFGYDYIFTEYHWDYSTTHGTVIPQEDTGIDLPPEIELDESTYDMPAKEGGYHNNNDLMEWISKTAANIEFDKK